MDQRGAIYPPAKAPPPFILQAWLVWGRESVWGGTSIHREAEARERVERAYVAATKACEERNGMERDRASPKDESAESSA